MNFIEEAAARIAPAHEAPAAVPELSEVTGKHWPPPVKRALYPVIIGWIDGAKWRYQGNPSTGMVASIPVDAGCVSSVWGHKDSVCYRITQYSAGVYTLTPEGVDFLSRHIPPPPRGYGAAFTATLRVGVPPPPPRPNRWT